MNELFNKLKRPYNGTWDAVESDMAVFECILFRFPVRNVLMLKSVSKLWYNVISTKSFIISHRSWSKKNTKFFVFYDAGELEDNISIVREMHLMAPNGTYSESYSIPIFETLHKPILIASFNGLICCMNDVTPYETTFDVDLHICNPATREVLNLPKSQLSYDIPIFGVLHSNKYHIYKIFKFFTDPADPENSYYSQCEVYSSKMGKWKLLSNIPSHTLLVNPSRSSVSTHVCINEKLYWFISDDREGEIDFPTSTLTVDMDDNFCEIPLPTYTGMVFLIEFRGQLCFVDWRGLKFCLWLYDEKNDGWLLLDKVKFLGNWLEVEHFDSVVAHDDEILFVYKDVADLRHGILYDVGHAKWKDFCLTEDDKDKAIAVVSFFETLLPCKSRW